MMDEQEVSRNGIRSTGSAATPVAHMIWAMMFKVLNKDLKQNWSAFGLRIWEGSKTLKPDWERIWKGLPLKPFRAPKAKHVKQGLTNTGLKLNKEQPKLSKQGLNPMQH